MSFTTNPTDLAACNTFIVTVSSPQNGTDDEIVLNGAHQQFSAMGAVAIHALGKAQHAIFDL